jgi:hypothetical protein
MTAEAGLAPVVPIESARWRPRKPGRSAWADRREHDDQFHDVLEAEFRAEASGG